MAVVLLHATTIWKVKPVLYLPIIENMGWVSVRLFFVISGFIIAERIKYAPSLPNFLLRRYLRVLPLNMFATLVALSISWIIGGAIFTAPLTDSGAEYAPGFLYLAKSMFIWPQDSWPYLFVGWSLEFEVIFYAVFGSLVFLLNQRLASILFVSGAILLWLKAGFGVDYTLTYYLYFAFGVVGREWVKRQPGPVPALILGLVGSLVIISASEFGVDFGNWFIFLTGLGFMGFVVAFVVLEKRGTIFTKPNFLTWLGDISFSLYLIHAIVVNFAGLLARGLEQTPLMTEGFRIIVVALSILCAAMTSRWIEKPALRQTKSWVTRLTT